MQRDYLIRVETESMLDFKRLNGLMIGFVIKGEAHIYDENNMTQCNSGDIFIINHRDLYRFQLQQDGIICYIQFQMKYLADKFEFHIESCVWMIIYPHLVQDVGYH